MAQHLALLDQKLYELATGRIKRLMVLMPPRHGKSLLASHYFPAWYIGRYKKRVILSSYEATFAASWGKRARRVLETYGEQVFGVSVAGDSSAADWWELSTHDGAMMTAGVGGAITGKGADILIIDDPVKNAKEAASQTYRDAAWEWYTSTAVTRLEPDGGVLLIQTRWHEDDLAGRLLAAQQSGDGDAWEVLSLPALAEEVEHVALAGGMVYHREPREALFPYRFDVPRLEAIQRRVGPIVWVALYQQRPSPADGKLFKRAHFRYFSLEADGAVYVLHQPDGSVLRYLASECWCFQTVDVAASTKTSADYTVVTTWVVTPNADLLVRHVVREHFEGPDQAPLLRGQYDAWLPAMVGIESVAYQLTLVQAAVRAGLPAREVKADRDKVSRALPIAARYASGSVYHLRGAPWLDAWESEYLRFPNGAHDDMVDTGGHAGRLLAEILGEVESGTDQVLPAAPPLILGGHRG